VFYATMDWDELARSVLESIQEQHGGLVVAFVVLAFFSIVILVSVVSISWYILYKKQKEVDRLAGEKKKLEEQILRNRRSSRQ